jgi:transposase-like protein
MKICKVCKKEFNPKQKTEKYCTTECAYTAIRSKMSDRNKKYTQVKCIACNGKGKVNRITRNTLSEKQKRDILSLYRKGFGIREIQREVKANHPYTISYYIKTCNL